MKTYETVFIVRPDLAQEDLDKELEFYKNNIEQHGGKIIKVELGGANRQWLMTLKTSEKAFTFSSSSKQKLTTTKSLSSDTVTTKM